MAVKSVRAGSKAPRRVQPPDEDGGTGRERLIRAGYDLFSQQGTQTVGVDTVVAEAGVAKMTLYRNFASKDELILAVLQRREDRWTYGWVRDGSADRAETPAEQLLAIFDLFNEWFQRRDFEGCTFVTTMLEISDTSSRVRRASVTHLKNIRAILCDLAAKAGVEDPAAFASQWHLLMKGSLVARAEGAKKAAVRAKELGVILLEHHGISV
jgi:AcrR family transcriptional regulator